MNIKYGNIFSSQDDYVFVTTNSFVKKDGRLVMGRGAAFQLAELRPDIPKLFGEAVLSLCGHLGKYGIIWELQPYGAFSPTYGAFQVKYNWSDKADLDLIKFSTELLSNYLDGILKGYTVSLNCPGIGAGGLDYKDVYPIIKELPDSVTIYRKLEEVKEKRGWLSRTFGGHSYND